MTCPGNYRRSSVPVFVPSMYYGALTTLIGVVSDTICSNMGNPKVKNHADRLRSPGCIYKYLVLVRVSQ